MCIILAITKPALITNSMLIECAYSNPDSVGLSFVNRGTVITLKSTKVVEGHKMFAEASKKHDKGTGILMHYRISTSGKIDTLNCHPFLFQDKKMSFAHNGIISGLGNKQLSDTRELLSILDSLNLDMNNHKHIELLKLIAGYSNKFVILDNSGHLTIINSKQGIFENGNWFSNRSYKAYEPINMTAQKNTKFWQLPSRATQINSHVITRHSTAFCRVCDRLLTGNEIGMNICFDCLEEKNYTPYHSHNGLID